LARNSTELLDFLTSSDRPKQVLVRVRSRSRPLSTIHEERIAGHEQFVEQDRHGLIQTLRREQERDGRVQFNPLAALDQIAAQPAVIVQIARRPDVADIDLDEPEKVLDDPPGDESDGLPLEFDI
jgi:hypothetical protein